ncbi:putative leucine-rich repeat domain superfamily [Helianthus annuus]|nr:putative leucine-rich repeat domain superfamily [Helianthus annuus]KAJ0540932.1 putative leucine-rich repeat domain superfamily [Helianthus annuus]
MVLALSYCSLGYNNDDHVVFSARSLFELYLQGNPFENLLSNIIDLKILRILYLYSCPNLKSLLCIPSTVQELNIDWCESLERITFQSGRFSLQTFDYRGCFNLTEVQGLFNLVPLAKLDEANLGHMKWIKPFQHQKVDLVGDEITKGRSWRTQMLYEYGIMSTYLQIINDQHTPTYEYTSPFPILSFSVPSHQKKQRIQGLNVSCLYKSLSEDKDLRYLLAKISNRTKGLTWIYNPMVHCKPSVNENVVWLSYWPIGNVLDAGDEVHVGIYADRRTSVSGCGASLVYMDGEVYEKNIVKITR